MYLRTSKTFAHKKLEEYILRYKTQFDQLHCAALVITDLYTIAQKCFTAHVLFNAHVAHTTELYNCVVQDFPCRVCSSLEHFMSVCGKWGTNLITCLSWCWQGSRPEVLKRFNTVTMISAQSEIAVVLNHFLTFEGSLQMWRVRYNTCLWRQTLGTVHYKVLCLSNCIDYISKKPEVLWKKQYIQKDSAMIREGNRSERQPHAQQFKWERKEQ